MAKNIIMYIIMYTIGRYSYVTFLVTHSKLEWGSAGSSEGLCFRNLVKYI